MTIDTLCRHCNKWLKQDAVKNNHYRGINSCICDECLKRPIPWTNLVCKLQRFTL